MKNLILLFILSIGVNYNLWSQTTLRIFGGINITNANYRLIIKSTETDSGGLRRNNYILPLLGADIDFSLTEKLSLTSGLGLSWMGSRNFNSQIPKEFNIDHNLRIGYLRVPFVFNFEIIKDFKLIFGYSLNYTFRKNEQFFISDDNVQEKNIYHEINHGGIFGLRKDINNWSIIVNYYKGLTRVFDSKHYEFDRQAYLTLGGVQISLGYLIK